VINKVFIPALEYHTTFYSPTKNQVTKLENKLATWLKHQIPMNSKRGSNQVWLSQQEGGFGVKRPQEACDSALLANILYNGLRDQATLCSLTTRQRLRDNPYLLGGI
jgi:hypothetical protein